ncbi:MAG: bifunctional phosphopantothenoylcysteine decarboxylase/phosphopantothenate--cysteine ligase CoaBC [Candidatus Margulisiibacteriota bacterium]
MDSRPTLRGKKIILGVTGCIAAYKSAEILRALKKKGADVWVVMTDSAQEFITPLTFRTLSGNPCITNMFDKAVESMPLPHISLSEGTDLVLVAPSTANMIAKAANGIADDILSTILMSCDAKKVFAPAMNTKMWESRVLRDNLKRVSSLGISIVGPFYGELACGSTGQGKMAGIDEIIAKVDELIGIPQDLAGKKILVTAGGTREPIDPVRFIGNRSSGRMGYETARAAFERGAQVTLISSACALQVPEGVNAEFVETSAQMDKAVQKNFPLHDALIMAAAVSDFRAAKQERSKIKKSDKGIELKMENTEDILSSLKERPKSKKIAGFCVESKDLIKNARNKLTDKKLDLIAANDTGAFDSADSEVVLLLKGGKTEKLPRQNKFKTANRILDLLFDAV